MNNVKKAFGISSPKRPLQNSSAIQEAPTARLQKSLLKACNLSDLIDLINLDMANVLAEEIEYSIEDFSETRWQDCVSVKWNGKGAIREFHGHVSTAEMEQSAIFVQQHPKFSSSCYVIHDFRKCTSLQVSDTDAFIMAVQAANVIKTKPTFRSAFVGNLPELKRMVDIFKTVTNCKMPFAQFRYMSSARLFALST